MLKPKVLEDNIRKALEEYIPIAFEEALKTTIPQKTSKSDEMCKEFGQTIADILSEPLANSLAAAIDFYVKNIGISGTIITVGSPTTQTANIMSTPVPTQNGIIPNTLKIF